MLPILYQDDHLVVIHKPSGLLVHRSQLDRHETRFAVQILRDQLGRWVQPVHRLDKGTSGALVFAFDKSVAMLLSSQFESQTVEKTYLAIVRGWPPACGLIDHPLARIRDAHESPLPEDTPAQPARTAFRTLATIELPYAVPPYPCSRYALMQLDPETGRRHQIRRHLKHCAHPIIGDATYGKGAHNRLFKSMLGSDRLLLACVRIAFAHPMTGESVACMAPLSGDFLRVTDRLGWREALPPGTAD